MIGAARPLLQHSRMALGRASVFMSADFAARLLRGRNFDHALALRLVDAIDIYLAGPPSANQLVREFHRANYIGAGALLDRQSGRGRRSQKPHLIAYLAFFRVILEDSNPAWRAKGWTITPGRDEAEEAYWLVDALGDEMQAGTAPAIRSRSGPNRTMSDFEVMAQAWLALNHHDVTWSPSITRKAKQLYLLNIVNRLRPGPRRGNYSRRRVLN